MSEKSRREQVRHLLTQGQASKALSLIYEWTKEGLIDFSEFQQALSLCEDFRSSSMSARVL